MKVMAILPGGILGLAEPLGNRRIHGQHFRAQFRS
jgi:hypothetical protein